MTVQTFRPAPPSYKVRFMAAFALIFGLMTIISGGSVLFGPTEAQTWAGDFIGFIVWFNFLAGWAYVVAAIGLWGGKLWAARIAALIAIATAVVALGFLIVVLRGSPFEMRTAGALMFRIAVWVSIALVAKVATKPI